MRNDFKTGHFMAKWTISSRIGIWYVLFKKKGKQKLPYKITSFGG
jgi:hypothetical protein